MKKVWKCDFCHFTSVLHAETERHELSCSNNPALMLCNTCDHQEFMEYSLDTCCAIHNLGFYVEVEDGDKICSDWTNRKETAKKIKKILVNINQNL